MSLWIAALNFRSVKFRMARGGQDRQTSKHGRLKAVKHTLAEGPKMVVIGGSS